jgi:metallo-beta-lactamase family protein
MCSGGRIVHHLKHNLWHEKCHVIFVGYQARGTLGRRLVDGEKLLRIAGEEVAVRAKIHTLNGYSAHADRRDLLAWAANFASRPTFLVTHGEPESSESLASALREQGFSASVPTLGEEFDLLRPERTFEPEPLVSDNRRVAMSLLSEIATLAASMRDTPDGEKEWGPTIPLLQSVRVLLAESGRISIPSSAVPRV